MVSGLARSKVGATRLQKGFDCRNKSRLHELILQVRPSGVSTSSLSMGRNWAAPALTPLGPFP